MPINIILMITLIWSNSIIVGGASQYGSGVMERVVETRQGWGQLPENLSEYSVFAAVRECSDIGKEFWIRPIGGKWERALATDCASKNDHQSETDLRSGYQWMVDGNLWAEIDGKTVIRWSEEYDENFRGRMVPIEMVNWLPQAGNYKNG